VKDPSELLQKVAKLWQWQYSLPVHELTCGSAECGQTLAIGIDGDSVFLVCRECGYTQEHIPDIVFAELEPEPLCPELDGPLEE
jgi:hypothetical protein